VKLPYCDRVLKIYLTPKGAVVSAREDERIYITVIPSLAVWLPGGILAYRPPPPRDLVVKMAEKEGG